MFWILFASFFCLSVYCKYKNRQASNVANKAYELGYQQAAADTDRARQQYAAWERQAKEAYAFAQAQKDKSLHVLKLTAMPQSLGELKKARNTAMLEIHPDLGGSHEFATEVNDAYTELLRRLGLGNAA